MKCLKILLLLIALSFSTMFPSAVITPVAMHGKLSVDGVKLTDTHGDPFQLRGISTHGINWDVGRPYVNRDTFKTLRDEWGVNAVRLALYTMEYNGYCNGGDKKSLMKLVDDGVLYATELGLYVIIDWHTLSDGNPLENLDEALVFFDTVSKKYKDSVNVLYEICNEPNDCTWDDIKKYSEKVVPVIRANSPDAVIIIGTPSWSQLGAQARSNEVADYPLSEYKNIMYSLHFYTAENYHNQFLPDKLTYAIEKGLPVFVSEFGLTEASGHGKLDLESAEKWLNLLDEHGISYFCWSLNNLDAPSAMLAPGTVPVSGWGEDELSDVGKWIKRYYSERVVSRPVP